MTVQPPSGGAAPAPGLSPRALIRESLGLLWRHRADLLRIAVVPVGATLAIDSALFLGAAPPGPQEAGAQGEGPGPIAFLLLALSIPPAALLAANWLRVLLLGPGAVPGLGLRWGGRESRFLLRMLVILLAGLVATFITIAPIAVLIGLTAGAIGGAVLVHWLTVLAVLAGMLVYGWVSLRLSPALAATATDRPATLGQAWAATRGLGGRLLLAGIGVVGPFYVATLLLPTLLIGAGLDRVAPLSSLLLQVVLASLSSVAGFTLVAVIYERLGGGRPGPTGLGA